MSTTLDDLQDRWPVFSSILVDYFAASPGARRGRKGDDATFLTRFSAVGGEKSPEFNGLHAELTGLIQRPGEASDLLNLTFGYVDAAGSPDRSHPGYIDRPQARSLITGLLSDLYTTDEEGDGADEEGAGSARDGEAAADPRMQVNIAVGYGGRQEIADAVRAVLRERAAAGASLEEVAESLSEEDITAHLYTKGQPDPDLVIRTSGEQRLSGFLLWQSVHSEYYFCEVYWPAFRRVDFLRALRDYSHRERRLGR